MREAAEEEIRGLEAELSRRRRIKDDTRGLASPMAKRAESANGDQFTSPERRRRHRRASPKSRPRVPTSAPVSGLVSALEAPASDRERNYSGMTSPDTPLLRRLTGLNLGKSPSSPSAPPNSPRTPGQAEFKRSDSRRHRSGTRTRSSSRHMTTRRVSSQHGGERRRRDERPSVLPPPRKAATTANNDAEPRSPGKLRKRPTSPVPRSPKVDELPTFTWSKGVTRYIRDLVRWEVQRETGDLRTALQSPTSTEDDGLVYGRDADDEGDRDGSALVPTHRRLPEAETVAMPTAESHSGQASTGANLIAQDRSGSVANTQHSPTAHRPSSQSRGIDSVLSGASAPRDGPTRPHQSDPSTSFTTAPDPNARSPRRAHQTRSPSPSPPEVPAPGSSSSSAHTTQALSSVRPSTGRATLGENATPNRNPGPGSRSNAAARRRATSSTAGSRGGGSVASGIGGNATGTHQDGSVRVEMSDALHSVRENAAAPAGASGNANGNWESDGLAGV